MKVHIFPAGFLSVCMYFIPDKMKKNVQYVSIVVAKILTFQIYEHRDYLDRKQCKHYLMSTSDFSILVGSH